MAVIARATVTLAAIRDVESVTRYYKLQSSTAAAPSKPAVNPPGSGWVTAEPSYTDGSTNSLYFTDLTVFTDGDFAYSDVSLSSSYEAAKAAYNKAVQAQEDADAVAQDLAAFMSASEIIVGTQTAATGAWTGVAGFSELKDGQQIAYWLPYAGSGNATLNLTLKGGGTTGAKNVYYRGATRATTHFAAGTVIHLTYRVDANVAGTAYTGWWADASYDSGNTVNRLRFEQAIKAKTAITASRFIVGDASGFFHLAAGVAFDITKPILWASSAIAVNATGTNNFMALNGLTLRNNLAGITLTQYETCYLVGTLSGRTFTVRTENFFTSTVPTSDDGYYYIALGYLYSTYQIYLYPEHPIYKFVNGQFMSLNQVAYEAKARADEAAKTATNYLHMSTQKGLVVSQDPVTSDADVEALTTPNSRVVGDGFDVYKDGKTRIAHFGGETVIGESGKAHMIIDSTSMKFNNSDGSSNMVIDNKVSGHGRKFERVTVDEDEKSYQNVQGELNVSTLASLIHSIVNNHTITSADGDFVSSATGVTLSITIRGDATYDPTTGMNTSMKTLTIEDFGGSASLNAGRLTFTPAEITVSDWTEYAQSWADEFNSGCQGYFIYLDFVLIYPIESVAMTVGSRRAGSTVGAGSVSIGSNNAASGTGSAAIGKDIEVTDDFGVIVGENNVEIENANTGAHEEVAFAVGAGGTTPFAVLKNGSLIMSSRISGRTETYTVPAGEKQEVDVEFENELPCTPFILMTPCTNGAVNNAANKASMGKVQLYLSIATTTGFKAFIINSGDRAHNISFTWLAICTFG